MKDLLKEYFQWYLTAETKDLPEAAVLDLAEPDFYEAELEGGWAKWRPKEKNEYFDLSPLEENAKITVHQSIKDYLNAYWFCALQIDYKGYELNLDPIVPGNYQRAFLSKLLGYKKAHGGSLEFIPIGMEYNTARILVIRNETGEVCLEEYEIGEYIVIATDLYQLLKDGE